MTRKSCLRSKVVLCCDSHEASIHLQKWKLLFLTSASHGPTTALPARLRAPKIAKLSSDSGSAGSEDIGGGSVVIATASSVTPTGSGSFASVGRGSLQRQANIMQMEVNITAAAVTRVNSQPFIPLRRAQQIKVTPVSPSYF